MTSRRAPALGLLGVVCAAVCVLALRGLGGCASVGISPGQEGGSKPTDRDIASDTMSGADRTGSSGDTDGSGQHEDAGGCAAGNTEACGNCGIRTCNSFGAWGSCTGEGACTPADIQDCALGARTCTSACTWGPCSCPTTPVCKKGATQACGSCGTQTCNSCGGWGSCNGEGACAPGAVQTCNRGAKTCGASCTWGPCSCPATPVCASGDKQACGNCGTQECDSCGGWGTCAGQGVCTPGAIGPDGCYMGVEATCNASCDWVCP